MSILIGLYVADRLSSDASVTDKVGDRIYPVVATQGVEGFPYIVYSVAGNDDTSTKDGSGEDAVSVQIRVVSKRYSETLLVGNAVRKAFDGNLAKYDAFKVTEVGSMNYSDDYADDLDAFVLNLTIEFKTIDLWNH